MNHLLGTTDLQSDEIKDKMDLNKEYVKAEQRQLQSMKDKDKEIYLQNISQQFVHQTKLIQNSNSNNTNQGKSYPSSSIVNPSQNPVSQSQTGNSNNVNSAIDTSKKSGFMQSISGSGNSGSDDIQNSNNLLPKAILGANQNTPNGGMLDSTPQQRQLNSAG